MPSFDWAFIERMGPWGLVCWIMATQTILIYLLVRAVLSTLTQTIADLAATRAALPGPAPTPATPPTESRTTP